MKTLLLFLILFSFPFLSRSQWSYSELTEAKYRIGVASLGTKAYFAGGENASGQASRVEIYDTDLDGWDTILHLLFPRSHIASVACGNKVFFAGGIDFQSFSFFDIVDILDTETLQWTWEELSAPRFSISAVSYGHQVLFAGGTNFLQGQAYDIVDIYDVESGTWSYTNLSIPRSSMGAAVAGNLAFFAGGSDIQGNIFDRVDIYNFSTNTWTIASLSQARTFLTAAVVGTKVLFAGGTTAENKSSDRVDIYDIETGTWETASLSQPRAFWEGNSASVCDERAYFVGGGIFDLTTNAYGDPFNTIDIYHAADGEWTTDTTVIPVLAHAVTGVDDKLLIAGGMSNTGFTSMFQIFTDANCIHPGIQPAVVSRQSSVSVYPNPTHGIVDLQFTVYNLQRISLKIYDFQGREVEVVLDEVMPAGEHTVRCDASRLPAGIYYYRLTTEDYRLTTGKLVKY